LNHQTKIDFFLDDEDFSGQNHVFTEKQFVF